MFSETPHDDITDYCAPLYRNNYLTYKMAITSRTVILEKVDFFDCTPP